MDSPPEANRIPAAPSSSSPDDAFSSPRPVQESPLFTFLANLSPIKSAKAAARYLQRFSQTNLPIPLPVFTSPRVDLQRSTSFEKREEPDAAGSDVYATSDTQLKPEVIACSQKEVQSCSLSGCIEDYLADPVEAEDATNTSDVCLQQNNGKLEFGSSFAGHKENIPKACDSNDSNTKTTIQLCQTGEDLSSASMNQSTFFRADDNANSDLFLDPFSREQHEEQFINQEAGQHQRGIRRHLQFEATMACDQKTNEADDTVDLSLLTSLVNIESVRGVSIPSVVRETFVNVEDHQQESLPTATATSATSQSPKSVQYPCDSVYVTPFEQQATPCAVRILTSQVTDNTEESNQVNTKKNRKRAQNNSENEDCKRCNCKRSKCLKLYCECFAAGIYCLDTCACDNCFNKPEYEDTVQDTRQQIESRNPLAFAPRVVKYAANSPEKMVEEGNRATPSSARHKRGCNCKKSKCLKKYCECYQAGVGCSEGCRCEGCGNAYGKKEEPRYRGAHRLENLSRDQLDTLGSRNNCMAVERAYESSPTREELADLSHGTPLPYSQSREVASSASVNIRDGEKVPGAQSIHDGNLLLPPAHLNWGHSPADFTPKLHGRKATPGISFYDILKEGDTPEMLKNTSIPTETINASSPNQKQVSLPQTRLQELQSVSSQTFRGGRKFVLPAVPSFPPLTPYCKLKGGIHKTNDDHK